MDKIAHFTFVSPLCQLCRKVKESKVHLLKEYLKAKMILKTIGKRCFVLKIPGWKSADFVCGHGWGKKQKQRHKPKESEEKCLLVIKNIKGGTNECDIRWEKRESKTNQKEEKNKKKDKLV